MNKEAGLIWFLIVAFVACSLLMPFIGCDATYSEGYRDGTVQKLSLQGFFIKSLEGELAMDGFKIKGGAETNTWAFSIDDREAIEPDLFALRPDTKVRLHYRQVLVNARAWHDSSYRIVKVERK